MERSNAAVADSRRTVTGDRPASGFAAGALLAMLASSMTPDAREKWASRQG